MEEELRGYIEESSKKFAKVYSALDWTWIDSENPPTKKEISDTLWKLYTDIRANKEVLETSTGGLYFRREEGTLEFGMDIFGDCVLEV